MDKEPVMNILLVAEHFHPYGGAELSLWKLAGNLIQHGHKIYVVTARRKDEAGFEVRDGIKIHRPFKTGNTVQRFIFALRLYPYLSKWLRGKEVDILYNLGYVATLPATYAAARHGIPTITMLSHLCGKDWFKLANPLAALMNYFMEVVTIRFGRHNVLVVQCQDSARQVARRTRTETRVICNTFLEPEQIEQARGTDIVGVRQALGVGEDELLLLFVGALIPTKNAAALIKALAGSKKKFKLVMVGEGPERVKIEGLLRRLNLESNVILLGQKPHSETLSLIKACDVFLLPSISEQVPNVLLEALALGKPVVATKVGGIPEIKSANLHLMDELNEINGILDGDIVAAAGDKIVEEYSLDNIAGRYEELFQTVIHSKNKRG